MRTAGTSETDAELLLRTAHEPLAFGEFYDRHIGSLLAFLAARTRSTEIAYDLAGEVFAAALEGAGRFRAPQDGSARPWLYGIARNKLADLFRRQQVDNDVRRRLGLEPTALTNDGLERVEALIASAPATAALDDLRADEQAAIVARVLDEDDYPSIAARFSVSESVVRKRVSRGLSRLRSQLSEDRT